MNLGGIALLALILGLTVVLPRVIRRWDGEWTDPPA